MNQNLLKTAKPRLLLLGAVLLLISCQTNLKNKQEKTVTTPNFKLSLAQWSVHKAIIDKKLDPLDFAKKAKDMGFEGLEYVSQLYTPLYSKSTDPKAALQSILDTLKARSETYGMQSIGIMVDNEGDLASPNDKDRELGVENHKKWIDAAAFLGCNYIRVNLFGSDDESIWVSQSVKSLAQLAEYAKAKNLNVIVENHGYLSSNIPVLTQVIKGVNLPNCGVLPDFGNFCLKREGGERWGAKCVEEYDRYKGVEQMMPFAKAVSAKSYDFDNKGDETLINYYKMLQIVKDGGYQGFIGVEYEGERLTEDEGIIATKNLVIKAIQALK